MRKGALLFLLIVLSGCQKERFVTCEKKDGKNLFYADLQAEFDQIRSAQYIEKYYVGYEPLADPTFLADLKENGIFGRFEEPYLVLETRIVPEDEYSLQATREELEKNYFYCSGGKQ